MALYRLYTYDPPGSPFYKDPALGGFLYNTGRFDSAQPLGQGCIVPDAQGFNDFPSLLQYATARGELLKGPVTRDFVNSLCGGQITVDGTPVGATAGPGAPTPSGGGTGGTGGGCSGASCGPSGPAGGSGTGGGPPTGSGTGTGAGAGAGPGTGTGTGSGAGAGSSACSGTGSSYKGGAPDPTKGSLSGADTAMSTNCAGTAAGTGAGKGTNAAPGPPAPTGFDVVAFAKSPFGILVLVLLIVILLTQNPPKVG